MDVDVALGVPLWRLFAADEVEKFGEEAAGEAGLGEEIEAASAVVGDDDFGEFIADAFGGNLAEERGAVMEGGLEIWSEFEAGGDGEADGAEEAEGVFLEAGGGVADSAEDSGFEVSLAAYEVDDFVGEGVLEEAVDGEVAALGVFFRGRKFDGFGSAAIGV